MKTPLNLKKVVISAPFGNYLTFPNTTSTLGTFTKNYRAGPLKRLWKVLSTVRYQPKTKSWVNKLGLPNPGIDAIRIGYQPDSYVSVHGFTENEWTSLIYQVNWICSTVELNLSCPNVQKPDVSAAFQAIHVALSLGTPVVAKLPPIRWMDYGVPLYKEGVRNFHLCNTIPTPGGGMSGKPLKQYSLWAVSDFRQAFGDTVNLIGGGGITTLDDVREYVTAGADHVSVGSMLFNPLNWRKIKEFVSFMENHPT